MRSLALLVLCAVIVSTLTSCVLTYKLDEEKVKNEANTEIVHYDEIPEHEKPEYLVLDIPEHVVSTVDTLPEGSFKTVTPVGNNPTFYVYDDSLTIYGYELFSDKYSTCTLNLPKGYTDGRIAHMSSGAGSGEVELILTATKNKTTVYLAYLFYAGNEAGYLSPVTICELSKKPDYMD